MTQDVFRLEKNGLVVQVSPLGGAILSASWRGIDVLAAALTPGLASQVHGNEACFPLVPFGNRIEDNTFTFEGRRYGLVPNTSDPLALHGDAWLGRWTVLRHQTDEISLHYQQEADLATPLAYEARQTVTVGRDDLSLSLTVVNRADHALPFGLGFHPYFPRTPLPAFSHAPDASGRSRKAILQAPPSPSPPISVSPPADTCRRTG